MRRSLLSCGRRLQGFTTSSVKQSPRETVVENIVAFRKIARANTEAELAEAAKVVKFDAKTVPAELKGTNVELYLSTPEMVTILIN